MTLYNNFEVINHGVWVVDQFPGCGTALTPYTHAVTGIGIDVEEAYYDAVDRAFASYDDGDVPDFPAFADTPIRDDDDHINFMVDDQFVYVTLRWGCVTC